ARCIAVITLFRTSFQTIATSDRDSRTRTGRDHWCKLTSRAATGSSNLVAVVAPLTRFFNAVRAGRRYATSRFRNPVFVRPLAIETWVENTICTTCRTLLALLTRLKRTIAANRQAA